MVICQRESDGRRVFVVALCFKFQSMVCAGQLARQGLVLCLHTNGSSSNGLLFISMSVSSGDVAIIGTRFNTLKLLSKLLIQ